jgi:Carboxypeptidase regulatory-like domain
MKMLKSGSRLWTLLLVSGLLVPCLIPSPGVAAGYGKLAGIVSDTQGNPLMGATVMMIGPTAIATEMTSQTVERVITNAHGQFTIEHLVPGWYSLKVISPTRLPAMRNGIRVDADETAVARFVLTDIFAPIRFQVPNSSVSTWGDDWKWVLRTSSTTRPILRYRQAQKVAKVYSPNAKMPLPQSQYMVGMLPGSLRRDPLTDDPGLGSVVAYVRSLSVDSDLLVAGSFATTSTQASTVTTVYRRNLLKGDPQEFGVSIHQFNLAGGFPLSGEAGQNFSSHGQGLVLTYSETRLLSPKVTVTAGMDVDYLSAVGEVMTAQPHVKLEYQAAPSTVVTAQYGSARAEGADSLLERVGMMNAFPRLTERDYRLRMERLNHTEVSVNRRIGKTARVQVASYQDDFHNAAVWGLNIQGTPWLAGNFVPNPATNGIVMNAGNYQSAGFRAVYSQTFGSHLEALVSYATGDALTTRRWMAPGTRQDPQAMLRSEQTTALTGKISAEIPVTHTRIMTSYERVPNDRVSLVDPYGQAMLQVQPYLGVQIRQPLPTIAFLPAHIEALADFRNLTAQGYVPVSQGGEKPVVLSSGYRCFRGGFSVQF